MKQRLLRTTLALMLSVVVVAGCTNEKAPKADVKAEVSADISKLPAVGDDETLVTINDRVFTFGDFKAYWEKFDTRPLWVRKNLDNAVDRLINDHLIAKMAKADEGFRASGGAAGRVMMRVGSLWRDFYWQKVVADRVTFTRQEVLEFMPPQTLTLDVRQLVVADKGKIDELRAQLVDGGADLETVIRASSEGLTRERGGLTEHLEATDKSYPTEVLQAMLNAPVGEYSEVYSTPIGFLLFRVEKRMTPEDWQNQKYAQFEKKYRDKKARDMWAEELDRLVAQHDVVVDEATAKRYREVTAAGRSLTSIIGDTLVTIDGRKLVVGDVLDPSGSGVVHSGELVDSLVNRAVENIAVVSEVKATGMADPEIERMAEYLENNSLARAYLSYRAEHAEVTEGEVTAYYEENNAKEFSVPAADRYSVIETRNRQRVEKIYALLDGGTPFEEVARMWSDHQSASKGGDIGFLEPSKVAPGYEKVRDLHVGAYLKEPVEFNREGDELWVFVVFKKTETRPETVKPLDDGLKRFIANRLMAWKRENTAAAVLAELKDSEARVEVDTGVLDRYYASLEKPEGAEKVGGSFH